MIYADELVRPDVDGWTKAEIAVLDDFLAKPYRLTLVPGRLKTYARIRKWALGIGRFTSCAETVYPWRMTAGYICVCYCPASGRYECAPIQAARAFEAEWESTLSDMRFVGALDRQEGGVQ